MALIQVTIPLDDDLVLVGRKVAAERNTTLEKMLVEYLELCARGHSEPKSGDRES